MTVPASPEDKARWRWLATVLAAAALSVAACSGSPQATSSEAGGSNASGSEAGSSEAGSSEAGAGNGGEPTASGTSPTTAVVGAPTLPPEALEELAEGSAGDPDPPLPPDLLPVPFEPGQLASVGNIQFIVDEVVGPSDAPTTATPLTVELRLRNASRTTLSVDPGAFRLYYVSGASSTPGSSGGTAFGADLDPDTWGEGSLAFEVPAGERPVMVVFDGSSLGDQVLSGAVVVGS